MWFQEEKSVESVMRRASLVKMERNFNLEAEVKYHFYSIKMHILT